MLSTKTSKGTVFFGFFCYYSLVFLKHTFINPDSLCLLGDEVPDFAHLGKKCTHQFSFLSPQVLTWMQQVLKM